MHNYGEDDTIAAISTGAGEAGIGIVRISGKGALLVADKIFVSKRGKRPSGFQTFSTHYGWIAENHKAHTPRVFVDEVILTVMRAPKSYTKEDTVEVNCHGGPVALRRVLELVLESGCRLAKPGEFTKRAFLNGRIDLAQAEAVLDIIRAKTDSALSTGLEQLKGSLSVSLNSVRKQLLNILAVFEANIDFPEEEISVIQRKDAREQLSNINNKLLVLLSNAKRGRILREGIRAVICGKPNVGKSSLLNALLRHERSIVTSIAGTTRDTIEESVDIKGIPLRIIDTAGIAKPRGAIEKKAVSRSKMFVQSADLVILVFDGNKRLSKEDKTFIKGLHKKNVIAVINKIDLKQKIEKIILNKHFTSIIEISAKRSKNIGRLEEAIAGTFFSGKINAAEPAMVSNLRHVERIAQAQKLVAEAIKSLDNSLPLEIIAQSVKEAIGSLDLVLGKVFSEDLLDKIFSDFCIGK